ncbi:hypothetical protein [Rubrivirga sp.]|uniref:hypothetical protein n=1 Tax=Rubrivirga sp. TaxID=1885344 RepID=UPI003B52F0E6
MPRHFLQPYEFTIRERGIDTRLPIQAFDGNTSAVSEIARMFYQIQATGTHDARRQRVLRHHGTVRETPDSVCVQLKAGEYGIASSLFDVESGHEEEKSPTKADLFKHYVRFDAPSNATRAVVMLHKIGNRSVLNPLRDSLRAWFRGRHPLYVVEVSKLIPREILKRFLEEGDLTEIRLKRFRLPSDRTDILGTDGGLAEQVGTFYEVLRPKRGSRFRTPRFLNEIINGKRYTEVTALQEPDLSGVSVELEFGGSTKRVHLDDFNRFPNSLEVTDDLTFDEGQNPTFTSVDVVAQNLAGDFMRQLGMAGLDQDDPSQ